MSTCMFMDSPSFWLKHSELQSSNTKQPLPAKPFSLSHTLSLFCTTTFLKTAVYVTGISYAARINNVESVLCSARERRMAIYFFKSCVDGV